MKLPVPTRFRPGKAPADAAPERPVTLGPPSAGPPTKTPQSAASKQMPATQKKPTQNKPTQNKPPKPKGPKRPLYVRLLHLRHIAPNAWQRAVLGEGSVGLAVVLVLADLATAWTLLALPLAVAAVVKAHDLLAWLLGRPAVPPPAPKKKAAPVPKKAAPPKAAAPTPVPPAPDARTAPPPKGWRRR